MLSDGTQYTYYTSNAIANGSASTLNLAADYRSQASTP
jgi:hypothetical protein